MSVLAHVIEAAGIATVTLASVRAMAEKTAPPRALYAEFPMGRPLGKPGDAAFQHEVLASAFALLDAPSGPVLVDYPTTVETVEQPMACAVPPRFDPTLPAAVDEARGLRRAYDRSLAKRGRSDVGRVISADDVATVLGIFDEIATGADWTTCGLPSKNTTALCHDIRSYYEEAALELATGPAPGGRAAETWFHQETEAGKTILAARAAIRAQGAKMPVWFYMTPGHL